MRVLIVSQYYRPAFAFGGTVVNAVGLAEGLGALGHDVTVLTSSVTTSGQRPSFRSTTECCNGVTVRRAGTCGSFGKMLLNPAAISLVRDIRSFAVVYIIGTYDTLGPIAAAQAARNRIPYIVAPSGMMGMYGPRSRLKRWYRRAAGKAVLEGAAVITVSSWVEHHEVAVAALRIRQISLQRLVVPDGPATPVEPVQPFRTLRGAGAAPPIILWMGRMDPIKNLEHLLAALAGLRELPWQVALVGPCESPAYQISLQRRATALGIGDRVHFLPELDEHAKWEALTVAHILVLTSHRESWGIVVQEAIAAGTPVLVTEGVGAADMVNEGAGLVVGQSVSAIRAGIKRLLTDRDLYLQCVGALADLERAWSRDKALAGVVDLLKSVETSGARR